jgi:hypothetical protein
MQIICIKIGPLLSSAPVSKLATNLLVRARLVQTAQRSTSAVLVVAILWVLTLTVSPQIHELIHPDADHEDHDCAVTLFLGGGLAHSSLLPSLVAGPLFTFLGHTSSLPSEILAALFPGQRISERGPPLTGESH